MMHPYGCKPFRVAASFGDEEAAGLDVTEDAAEEAPTVLRH